jgi:hypothetical protein
LTHLPAVIGRSHESSNDPSFFGLGKYKALSRQQCRILYLTDIYGGQLVVNHNNNDNNDSSSSLSYKPPSSSPRGVKLEILRSSSDTSSSLPTDGFFVIECLGKNRIVVDQTRVEHGQMASLRHGSKIRISGYYLHFLLPTTTTTTNETTATATMTVPNPEYIKRPIPASSLKQQNKTTKRKKTDFSQLSTQELLDAFFEAKGSWESLSTKQMNTEILLRAVKAAARDESLRQQAAADNNDKGGAGGLPRTAIMEWMEESRTFGAWMEEVLARMEASTLQGKVRKSMLAAGYKQDPSTAGYGARWMLPPLENNEEEKAKQSGNDDDDRAGDEADDEKYGDQQEGGVLGSLSAMQERSDGNAAKHAQEPASEEQAASSALGSGIDSANEAPADL